MHIRIYWGKVQSGAWPSIERNYRELMDIPIHGLLGRFVTQDVNDPESMFTITFWQDLQSIEAWEKSSEYRDVFLAAVSPFIIGSQSVSLCEVKLAMLTGLRDNLLRE
jgi:heme-degrading monooxygenase HmoA